MSYPDMHVEIAFGIDPYVVPDPGDWIDVTEDFIGATIKHGRQSVLDEYQPANATIELWNLERQYEADYVSGGYYPDIVGDTWIRAWTEYASVDDFLFTGLVDIDGWQPEWVSPQKVTIQATGYTRALGVKTLTNPWKYEVLADAPLVCFPMFETDGTIAYDLSGNNLNGAYVNGPVLLGQDDPVTDGTASGKLSNLAYPGFLEAPYGFDGTGPFVATIWLKVLFNPSGDDLDPIKFGLVPGVGREAELIVTPAGGGAGATHHRLSFYIDNDFALETVVDFLNDEWAWINIIRESDGTVRLVRNRVEVNNAVSTATLGSGSFKAGQSGVLDDTGYVIAWPTFFDYRVSDARLDAQYEARNAWLGDHAGERLTKVFEQIGIDPLMGDFDTGNSDLTSALVDGVSALSHARAVEKAELGGLYELGSGAIKLRERHALYSAPYTTVQVTIGRGVSELPYEQIFPEQSVVYNEAVASRRDGQSFTATDTSTRFLIQSLSELGLELQSDGEAWDRVNWRIATLKDQKFYPAAVTLNPHADDSLWPHVLGRFLEDRVIVKRTSAAGTVVSRECAIQGITHVISPGQKWKTTWRLGPVESVLPAMVGVVGRAEVGAVVTGY